MEGEYWDYLCRQSSEEVYYENETIKVLNISNAEASLKEVKRSSLPPGYENTPSW